MTLSKSHFRIYAVAARSAWIICLFIHVQVGYSQPNRIYFDHITTEEGLSQNDVNCIHQDRHGFMWFGTNDGLNRYDGYEFKVFLPDANNPYAIRSNLVMSVAEDSCGGMWIGMAGSGLNYFDHGTEKFYDLRAYLPITHDLTENHIRFMMVDHFNRLWIGSLEGLHVLELTYSSSGKLNGVSDVSEEVVPASLRKIDTEYIFEDLDQSIWVGNDRGLFHLLPSVDGGKAFQSASFKIESNGTPRMVKTILRDMDGRLVISSLEGVFYQTTKKDSEVLTFENFSENRYQALMVDEHNRIWAAGSRGLDCFVRQKHQLTPHLTGSYTNSLEDAHSLNKDVLRTLYADRNGLIWVGTNGGGVNRFDPEKMAFRHFKKNLRNGSIGYDKIRSIFEDSKGNVWIGTEGGGLDFLSAQQDQGDYHQFQHIDGPSYVFAIEEVSLGKEQFLFIGGQQNPGLYYLPIPASSSAPLTQEIIPVPEFDRAVFAILYDQKGHLWVGTYNGGLYTIALESLSADLDIRNFRRDKNNPHSLSSDIIRSLLQDQQGNMWVGTGNGLNMIPAHSVGDSLPQFIRFQHEADNLHSLSHNYILALHESAAGELWIGTFGGGLNRYVPKQGPREAYFERFNEEDGLANNVVKGILEDEEGNLWISTNKGLSRFDPKARTFQNYDTHDGLQSNEFSELACFKRKSGEMLFGGVNGFNAFMPGSFKDNSQLPIVVFTEFEVWNGPVSAGEKIRNHVILKEPIFHTRHLQLRYYENSFSFGFSAMHYSAPGKNQYLYKLEGFDEDWIPVTSQIRQATYTNLSPGDYSILVKASNNDGIWNEQPSRISIHISPPFWLTWWAYLLYGFLIFLLLAAFRRYTVIGIKEKHELIVERLEKEKSEELHQMKLQFFTNISHELRTPLTLILGPLEQLRKTGHQLNSNQLDHQYTLIQKNAHFLLRLVNQLLDFRKLDQGKMKLNVQKGDLVTFIEEMTEPFQFVAKEKQIDFSIHCPPHRVEIWFDPGIVEKTVYNLLSNAFKFTPKFGKVRVEIDDQGQSWRKARRASKRWIELRVRDTGPGISEKKKKQIFERFYTFSSKGEKMGQGTGIGLAFTKSLVELHHGKISVESKKGMGSCFTVHLPVGRNGYRKSEIGTSSTFIPHSTLPPTVALQEKGKAELPAENLVNKTNTFPLVLVIDDHQGIRKFIKHSLNESYQVIEAEDGIEGLEMAIAHTPDFIISDVMMPRMNGIELCQQLRSNPQISHTPFVLLTAKTSEENELEGVKNGADAYIRKPFNMEVLEARIHQILAQRQELKNRFRKEVLLEPSAVAVASLDEEFLKKAVLVVETHMDNPEFSVEVMLKEMGMSRSTLYLKLKALTDQSTSEFIRTIRLRRAVQLLEGGGMSVKEIMYMTGFNTASYFSKCFKKQFGVSPSEYLKKEAPVDL